MPITYSIDPQYGFIVEMWVGDITADVLEAYWNELLSDADALAIRRSLADLRQADLNFNGQELSDLVSSVVVRKLAGRTWTSAVLVGRPDQFGVSRQYQVFAESYSTDCIFHDYEEAVNWLLTH